MKEQIDKVSKLATDSESAFIKIMCKHISKKKKKISYDYRGREIT